MFKRVNKLRMKTTVLIFLKILIICTIPLMKLWNFINIAHRTSSHIIAHYLCMHFVTRMLKSCERACVRWSLIKLFSFYQAWNVISFQWERYLTLVTIQNYQVPPFSVNLKTSFIISFCCDILTVQNSAKKE